MGLLRDDARQGCAARRARASSTPARVTVPVTISSAVMILAIAGAVLIGLSAPAVVAIAITVALAAALAAHRTVSSLAAGAGMRLARPYGPGEQVHLYVPALHSVADAEIVRVGPANTTLLTRRGLVVVPNSRMLRTGPEQPDSPEA